MAAWRLWCGLLVTVFVISFFKVSEAGNFTIDYDGNTFVKDGKPFQYVSGSLHYQRVHPYYWKDRLNKMRIGGLNAVQTYVPWNIHELTPGQFTFSGAADLPQFLTLAKEQGLVVLMRLGPYICGEWEFGGFPAWLLTMNRDMVLRTSDPSYLYFVDRWYSTLLTTIKPFLYENGGPIAMVQIENEYGSYFACDQPYLQFLLAKVRTVLGNNVVIYTTDGDGDGYLKCGTIKGAYATVDFGITDNPASNFKSQRDYEPKGPLVNSEFYTGWLDHWGDGHSTTDWVKVAKSLDKIIAYNASVNMYMYEGGTNFAYWNGANDPTYQPVPTSYDYDAPLNESGDITDKYLAVRDIISKYYELPPDPIPGNTPKGNYGIQQMAFVSTVQDALSTLCPEGPVKSVYPLTMEQIKHYYGFILYRHKLTSDVTGWLVTDGVRDRGYVMVNQVPQGMLYRTNQKMLLISGKAGQDLDILVENTGRVGYGTAINFMTKGIIYNVTLNNVTVTGWEIYAIHLENMAKVQPSPLRMRPETSKSGHLSTPSVYAGKVSFGDAGTAMDTFLDMRPWVKGQAFVNDFNVGRYWPQEGPQVTLYVPAPALNISTTNQLFMFELENSPCSQNDSITCTVRFTDTPCIDAKPASGFAGVKGWESRRVH